MVGTTTNVNRMRGATIATGHDNGLSQQRCEQREHPAGRAFIFALREGVEMRSVPKTYIIWMQHLPRRRAGCPCLHSLCCKCMRRNRNHGPGILRTASNLFSAVRRRQFPNHFQAVRRLPCPGLGRARRRNLNKMGMRLMLFNSPSTKLLLISC